jgi:leader peptidase (prepilin peptidase)/N-methyltransferase
MTENTGLLLGTFFILGLCVGSFLNVVIYRLPIQMQASWRRESLDFLGLDKEPEAPRLSIAFPSSQCTQCKHPLKPWHNIPFFSYLFLRGKCAFCSAPVSIQYPLVEIITGVATCFLVMHFGLTPLGAGAILFTWALIALTGIDLKHQLLPDIITLPLLWAGLLFNLYGGFTDLSSAVIGAVAGYLILWSVYWLFKIITGKEGMGHGDFKLLAALGAWYGWQLLPLTILLSALVGSIVGIGGIYFANKGKEIPIAFGPYLAMAGWIALIWGHQITSAYLGLL